MAHVVKSLFILVLQCFHSTHAIFVHQHDMVGNRIGNNNTSIGGAGVENARNSVSDEALPPGYSGCCRRESLCHPPGKGDFRSRLSSYEGVSYGLIVSVAVWVTPFDLALTVTRVTTATFVV